MTAALELRGVQKAWGVLKPRPALRGVWLRVERGECFGLAGPNGAGKTTLIRLLLGLSLPDAGEALLLGERPDDPELRRRVGFVPESATLPAGATPRELVRRWVRLRGLAREANVRGLQHVERLGLAALLDRPVGRFSKGEAQRTLLALALLGEPEVLVLDEPTDGLDPLGRALVREVVRQECAAGRTVFLNSHLLSETERMCTRVGILHAGQLVREAHMRAPVIGEGTSEVVLEAESTHAQRELVGARAAPKREGRGFSILVDHPNTAALNLAIDRLRGAGAMLLEVRPAGADLETTLVEAVEAVPQTEPSAPIVPPWAGEPTPPVPQPAVKPTRAPIAIARVALEIGAELGSQKIGWMLLLLAVVGLAGVYRVLQFDWVANGTEAAREVLRQMSPLELGRASRLAGEFSAQGLFWLLLVLATLMSSMFAVPLLEPRRTVLIYAQPVSRSDYALGLFFGVVGVAAFASFAYALMLWLLYGWLGLQVSPSFLLVPLPFTLAFGSLYGVVLLGTFAWRSSLFAGLCGMGSLGLFATLGNTPSLAPLYALSPKLLELGRLAGRLGEGGGLTAAPLVSTTLVLLALLVLLVTAARRSEA